MPASPGLNQQTIKTIDAVRPYVLVIFFANKRDKIQGQESYGCRPAAPNASFNQRQVHLPPWMAAATVQGGWFTLNPDSIETNSQARPKSASNKALPTLSRAGKDCSPQDTVLTPCYTRNEFLFLYLIIYA